MLLESSKINKQKLPFLAKLKKNPTPANGNKEIMAAVKLHNQSTKGKTLQLKIVQNILSGVSLIQQKTQDKKIQNVFKIIKWHMMVTH